MRISGAEAVARCLKKNDVYTAGVVGYPVTDLVEETDADVVPNEMVGVEKAIGRSFAGERGCLIAKHVGVNVALDPLASSATFGTGGGVLVIAGDDPGAVKSQDEGDSRSLGFKARVPVLTPSGVDGLLESVEEGLRLSEDVGVPCIVRVTSRLLESETAVERLRFDRIEETGEFDRQRAWKGPVVRRRKVFEEEIRPEIRRYVDSSDLHSLRDEGTDLGVLSCGDASEVVPDDVSHLSLGYSYPVPSEAERFVGRHDRVLVVEDGDPLIENFLDTQNVVGKETGHLPRYGRLTEEAVERGIETAFTDPSPVSPDIEKSGRPLPESNPFYEIYEGVVDDLLDVFVAVDIGSVALTGRPPFEFADGASALGSAISLASGHPEDAVAFVGDTAFIHSGIQGLLEASERDEDVLVVILNDGVSNLTGGQRVTGVEKLPSLIESCDPDVFAEESADRVVKASSKISSLLSKDGVRVISLIS